MIKYDFIMIPESESKIGYMYDSGYGLIMQEDYPEESFPAGPEDFVGFGYDDKKYIFNDEEVLNILDTYPNIFYVVLYLNRDDVDYLINKSNIIC